MEEKHHPLILKLLIGDANNNKTCWVCWCDLLSIMYLTVNLAEVEGTTVATMECLESRMSVLDTGMDEHVVDQSCQGFWHVVSPQVASLSPALNQAHGLAL